ncbi:MAG TPA: hypothetical protein VM779_07780 [Thermoanaerobaculia bacterium]|nr:hypothetical protein [Thermoanaerobaculia bacterium]
MNSDACRRYLEDPEAFGAHLAECAECRAVQEQLQAKVQNHALRIESLPLAPWEGAGHRSWALVLGGVLFVVAVTAALFAAAGTSPLPAISAALRQVIPARDVVVSFLDLGSGIVKAAPITIVVLFIAVNAALIALLRRAPKGIDV